MDKHLGFEKSVRVLASLQGLGFQKDFQGFKVSLGLKSSFVGNKVLGWNEIGLWQAFRFWENV